MKIIDYKEANVVDPLWWKRWRITTRQLEKDERMGSVQPILQLYCGLLANAKLEDTSFKELQEKSKKLIDLVQDSISPWLASEREEGLKQEAKTFREQWKEITGFYPDDPEGKAAWENQLQSVLNETEVLAQEKAKKEQEALDRYRQIAEQIKQKRLQQQGRRR